jgi:hypothetical protein
VKSNPLLFAIGCAVAFAAGTPLFAGELDGRWRGKWTDEVRDHEGRLRGRFRETRNGDYRVVFTGTFYKVIPFAFATKLNVVERDCDRVVFEGTSRVGGFGRFTYHAVAEGNQFNAQYQSRGWTGGFHLTR